MKPLTILTIYLIFMNLLAFLLMGLDKAKARRNRWRILIVQLGLAVYILSR